MIDVHDRRALDITPPPCSDLFLVQTPVDFDLPWNSAINAVVPVTPDSDDVRRVGGLFPSYKSGIAVENYLLLNFQKEARAFENYPLSWSRHSGLETTDLREVLAIQDTLKKKWGIHGFPQGLGSVKAYIVATATCSWREEVCVCRVSWGEEFHDKARLWSVNDLKHPRAWFAFRIPSHISRSDLLPPPLFLANTSD